MGNKKGSLSTVFLIIAIFLIIVMGVYIYIQKTESDKQIAKLENNASKLQEKIDNLQGKIDSVSNIINTDSSKNNTIKIEGEYHIVGNDNSEKLTYKFEGNTVKFIALYTTEGTYEIADNKIKITYSKAYDMDGELENFPNGQYEELTIIDENTLTSKKTINGVVYNSKYVKEGIKTQETNKLSDNKVDEITKRLEDNDVFSVTDFIKNNNGTYTLKGKILTVDTSKEQVAEYPFYKETGEYKQITITSDTKCVYSLDSNEFKTDTVENVFSKKLYFGGCFNFTFENGKCISVDEIVTGH